MKIFLHGRCPSNPLKIAYRGHILLNNLFYTVYVVHKIVQPRVGKVNSREGIKRGWSEKRDGEKRSRGGGRIARKYGNSKTFVV